MGSENNMSAIGREGWGDIEEDTDYHGTYTDAVFRDVRVKITEYNYFLNEPFFDDDERVYVPSVVAYGYFYERAVNIFVRKENIGDVMEAFEEIIPEHTGRTPDEFVLWAITCPHVETIWYPPHGVLYSPFKPCKFIEECEWND